MEAHLSTCIHSVPHPQLLMHSLFWQRHTCTAHLTAHVTNPYILPIVPPPRSPSTRLLSLAMCLPCCPLLPPPQAPASLLQLPPRSRHSRRQQEDSNHHPCTRTHHPSYRLPASPLPHSCGSSIPTLCGLPSLCNEMGQKENVLIGPHTPPGL